MAYRDSSLSWIAPLAGATFLTVYSLAPGPAATSSTAPRVEAAHPISSEAEEDVYFRTCADARAAGATPIHVGQPGYDDHLDGDGDGVACEPYYGRR